ncbi:MAG: MFS transporter [Candidatus Hodarchaeales archaeon]|jgi:GPH family glycoside/pentoside/hexuronide:cation symporter
MAVQGIDSSAYTPVRGQKLWWSMIELGSSISSAVLDTFVIGFYFFDVLGSYTGPGAVSRMFYLGLIVSLGKIIQGLVNLPIAQVSDRISTRWGRRRVFVLFGCVPWGLSVFMIYFIPATIPEFFSNSLMITLGWFAFWFIAYNIFNAAVVNPYLAMLPEIAKTQEERTSYNQVRTLFTFLAMIIISVTWPFLGEQLGSIIVFFIMVTSALILVKGSREDPSVKPATVSFKESASKVFQNPWFKAYIVTIMSWMAASGMLLAMLPILVEGLFGLDLDSPEVISWIGLVPADVMAIVSGLFVITALIAIPFIGIIQRRIGLKRNFQLVMVMFTVFVGSIAFIGLWPGTPTQGTDAHFLAMFSQLVISLLLSGIPAGGVAVLLYTVFSDVIDHDPYGGETERRESMYFAVQGVLDWGAASLGALVMGAILALFGSSDFNPLDSGILETGSLGIRMVVLLAATLMFLAAIYFNRYPEEK